MLDFQNNNQRTSSVMGVGDPSPAAFVAKQVKSGFIEGHLIPFEFKTTYPIVLTSAFARNSLIKPGIKYLKWGAPFEQALACNTLGE